MATTIDESVFNGIFGTFSQRALTTNATYWHLPEGGGSASYPTVYVPGNNTLMVDGQERTFKNGALVYQRNGRVEAIDANYADGGSVTVGGGRVQPTSIDSITHRVQGNIATLKYSPGQGAEPGQLSLTMPEGKGYGFAFRYPASTPQQLADAAREQNAIVKVKDASGEILQGFFTKGKGGILPAQYDGFTTGKNLDPGQFVAINTRPDGSVYLRPYQNYTKAEFDQFTQYGKYGPPSNNMTSLQSLDGKPLNIGDYPAVNVGLNGGTAPAEAATTKGPEGTQKAPDGQQTPTTKAPDGQPPAPGQVPDGQPPATNLPKPVDANVPPKVEAPAPAPEGLSSLGKLARYLAPLALTIGPVVEGASGGYEAYQARGSALDTAKGAVEGAGAGIVDTFLPGAKNGYGDVIGDGKLTWADRILNAADDLTGSATAIGSAAVVAETAGVVTIPAVIPTGAATIIAGISNLGVNAAKGALKVTGLAGEDQDGGYIYNGARAAINGVEHLFGSPAVDTHADDLLKQSAAGDTAGDGVAKNTAVDAQDRSFKPGNQAQTNADMRG